MRICARVQNSSGRHRVLVRTNDREQALEIPPKGSGFGSGTNGGELLFLALATCYCNDLYREAAKRGIAINSVEVTVEGDFGADGEPAANIVYSASVRGDASEDELRSLMTHTDGVAEIQNTLRIGAQVTLHRIETSGPPPADVDDSGGGA